MRRMKVRSFPMLGLLLLAGVAANQRGVADKIIAFCQEHKGQMVGDGECASLANQALRAAGAKGRGPDLPKEGDYTWGQQVFFIQGGEADQTSEGKSTDIVAGDIIQLRDVKFKGKKPGGTYSMTFSHHTAIVAGVEDGGKIVHIF